MSTDGFDVFVQLVIAAMTTRAVIDVLPPLTCVGATLAPPAWAVEHRVERAVEARLHFAEEHAILRALRAREARLDRAEIERQRVGERRSDVLRVVEEPLLLRVRLDERDLRVGAAREAQVLGASRRRSGRCRTSRRTRAPCSRSSRDRRAGAARGRRRRTRRTCRRRPSCGASA